MEKQITLKIKYRIDKYYELTISNSASVLQLKQQCAVKSDLAVEQQKLVSQEKLLQDQEILRDLNMDNGTIVYIIKAKPPGAPDDNSMNQLVGLVNQMGGGMGGMGGMGGLAGGLAGGEQDGNQLGQLFQNPMIQQVMQETMKNPEMMQQMVANNPMFQNGDMSSLLNNPEYIKMVAGMLQGPGMQQMMQNLGGAGQEQGGLNFMNQIWQQQQQGSQQNTFIPDNNSNNMNQFNEFGDNMQNQEKYQGKLKQLEECGFTDKEANIQALNKSYGNVQRAVNYLLGNE